MRLHDSKTAPNPRRVRIFLAEKGIEVPTVEVDIGKRENATAEFLRLNPLGRLPVLELDDGSAIAESVAICRWFEEQQPRPNLFGDTARERAEVEMWERRMEFEVFLPISMTFRHTHAFFRGRYPQVAEWGEECRRHAEHSLRWLDRELAAHEFIAGPRFTIADITALCAIDFGRVCGIRIAAEQENLKRWHAGVSARPSARA
jgi:glutathione S-transferase